MYSAAGNRLGLELLILQIDKYIAICCSKLEHSSISVAITMRDECLEMIVKSIITKRYFASDQETALYHSEGFITFN
jgi:hypothetical protein